MDEKSRLQAIINELDEREAQNIADLLELANAAKRAKGNNAAKTTPKAVGDLLKLASIAKMREDFKKCNQNYFDISTLYANDRERGEIIDDQPVIELQPVQEPAKDAPEKPKKKWFPYKRAWDGHKIPF